MITITKILVLNYIMFDMIDTVIALKVVPLFLPFHILRVSGVQGPDSIYKDVVLPV